MAHDDAHMRTLCVIAVIDGAAGDEGASAPVPGVTSGRSQIADYSRLRVAQRGGTAVCRSSTSGRCRLRPAQPGAAVSRVDEACRLAVLVSDVGVPAVPGR